MEPNTSKITAGNALTRIRRLQGREFVWWLIEKEGTPWIQALSPVLFLFSFSICFLVALGDFGRSFSLGLALVLQMFFHEGGHLLVLRRNGIRCRIWWLFPLGAAAAPVNPEEGAKSDALPWNTVAWMLQAGITANVAVMGAGSLLRSAPAGWLAGFGGDLLLTGGILAISNLLPFWKLDGSMMYHAVFSSLREKDDFRAALGLMGLLALAVLAALWSIGQLGFWNLAASFFQRLGWFVVIPVIAAGIWHRQGMDDPAFSSSAQAMTGRQATIHILLYIALLYLSLRLCLGPLSAFF